MTIKEIAKLAGVSVSTVSKIVNNKDSSINTDTRNRVLKIVKEYNYTPYGTVKKKSEAKTFTIGLLLSSALSQQFLQGILSTAQANGYCVQIFQTTNDPKLELKNIALLCSHHVDGVIWEPVSASSLDQKYQFERQDIEVTIIGPLSDLQIDFEHMGYEAVEALLNYGHSRIGVLAPDSNPRCRSLLDGAKRCLFDHNISCNDDMLLPLSSPQWLPGLLSHTFTGIICPFYDSALWLVKHLSDMHLHVPQDVSLITLDDTGANATFPALSAFHVPYTEFGSYLCQQLIRRCEKQQESGNDFHTLCCLNHTQSVEIPPATLSQKIVVVGSINIDITLNVDRLPQAGRTVSTNKHSIVLGGKGANQAIGAAKLGGQAVLIGKVGNDYDSTLVYSCMAENHVNADGIRRESHFQTGKAYIHVQNDGESMITILTGANQSLSPKDIRSYSSLFDQASYCLLQTEVPIDAVKAAALIAKEHNAKTILKPAAIDELPHDLMKCIDIFIPNREEAELLCPKYSQIEDKASEFIRLGAKAVIITLGHNGCYIKSADYSGFIPAADFTPVDTTGAADAFICALAVYLTSGYSLKKAAQIASCAAGFCISRQGVIPALIDKISLETYIQTTLPGLL